MSVRDEAAELLAEHWLAPGEGTCRCGVLVGAGVGIAPHLANVLAEAGLLMPDHEHRAMRWFGAPADLPCEVCGETGWAMLERMSPEMLAHLLSLGQKP